MRTVTRTGSNSKLLGLHSDPSPYSFQACVVVGSAFGLNCKVCSANSNSISLGAREPWGLKRTLVSLCCHSVTATLLARGATHSTPPLVLSLINASERRPARAFPATLTLMCVQQANSIYKEPAHFEQIDLTVCVVVILQAVERVVVSVTVDGAHGRTWGVAAVEVSAMTHAEGVSHRASAGKR